jgi:hypothetical protein
LQENLVLNAGERNQEPSGDRWFISESE